ncbi:MAG: NAD(+)/NADH kinase [Lachnospiraceae bacterium]|nr:NAD(+)/NADH kinase [Lachnospiraceae bacterium]
MDHFFVLTNQPKDKELKITNYICDYMRGRGKQCDYMVFAPEKERLGNNNRNPLNLPPDLECILVLGGDGTLLQAAMDTLYLDIPLLGINLGNLGFLAEVEQSHINGALDRLILGEWQQEERMMLSGTLRKAGKEPEKYHALNDIVLTREGSLRIVTYDIFVNGQFLNSYHADGVIVSTPTGSTGYNMSAGGPIVEPKAKLILITPICPHTLNTRSIVLSPEDEIEVRIGAGKNDEVQKTEVNFDGSFRETLKTEDSIVISQSGKVTRLIRLSRESFLEVLHKKISE